eukprot:TRINITY_DN7512_c2_g3_i1.p1 TRINITY_DN7512_c2_g3~~TRINITY_DN7512_c2_g3_i1.p1  ORF type:complete len:319 (-),score=17.63 TRINITY_DN7512_c2_g3_i1:151-1107(-)
MSSVLVIAVSNIIASVGIILTNKQLVTGLGFHFTLASLFLNFVTTATVCSTMAHLGRFEPKHLPPWDRWRVAALTVLTILSNNASVEANSVGFYQIFKLLIIPTVIGIERVQGIKRVYRWPVICSLIVSSIGVGMATVSDFEINTRGFILACLSDLITAQFQIWQSEKQREHGLSPTQIQHSVGWPTALIGGFSALAFDVLFPSIKSLLLLRPGGLLEYTFDGYKELYWLCFSCSIAVGMNLSTYALLGKTSPVTYQVIGQIKTCLVVCFGYFFFDSKAFDGTTFWLIFRFTGVAVASAGILSYGICKTKEPPASKKD